MRRLILATTAAVALFGSAALADLAVKDGAGTTRTIYNFVCQTTKLCNATTLINSAGAEIGTTGAPINVALPAATVTALAPPAAITGFATSTAQTTAQTSLGSIVTSLASIDGKASTPIPAQSTRTVNIGEVDVDFSRMASAPINVSTATSTQIVPISGSTAIYVTSYDVMAGGAGNVTFQYGTGSNCGTGTTVLTGAYPLTAQAGIAKGSGVGAVLKVPAGNALCVLTSAAVQMSGSVSYQQF